MGQTPEPSIADDSAEATVRACLDRVLGSSDFAASERSRSLLRYVVEETLAGRGERIKAFAIAVEVFGRDQSFDPQVDPLVRLEASRLRRALQHYYLTEGRDDPIAITIPKGGYLPRFVAREGTPPPVELPPHPAVRPRPQRQTGLMLAAGLAVLLVGTGLVAVTARWLQPAAPEEGALFRPSVLVARFAERGEAASGGDLAQGITEQLVAELTRFREIVVYGRAWPSTPGRDGSAMDLAQELSASHVLDGSVATTGDRIRVHARLESVRDGATLWSATYDRDLRAADLFALQDEIAAEVATRIAQPFGELTRAPPPADGRPDDLAAYRCGVDFYAYRRSFSRDQHAQVLACLEETVERHPDYATGWAMLALARVDSDRFGYTPATGRRSPLALAAEAARRAIALDQHDVRAWQALMLASYLSSDVAEGKAAGERALALNPNDLELIGEFGMRLAMAGDWARGTAMIRSVVDRDPAGSRFHLTILAVDALRQGRNEEALALLDRSQTAEVPTTAMLRAAALGHLGRIEEARLAGEIGLRALPALFERLDAEFAKRNFQPDVRRVLVDGWRRAGLPVPEETVIDPPTALTAGSGG